MDSSFAPQNTSRDAQHFLDRGVKMSQASLGLKYLKKLLFQFVQPLFVLTVTIITMENSCLKTILSPKQNNI